MVRQPDPGELRPQTGFSLSREKQLFATAVKLEVDDPLEEEHGPENKRSKCSSSLSSWNTDARGGLSDQPEYNPLDEPSPLGLRLRKSPSLVDLIQMRLSQGNSSKALLAAGGSSDGGIKKETRVFSSSSGDKIKASNFPATLLKIGGWEYVSRYEGDLVAKCYFAKRKLVWEVLEGGLKSKIEVQWSDIMDIKANYPENNSGTLDIVISRQPLFFRETNPQPRKHTLWQATSDFTGGQASIHRRHFLQVPQGLLGKHFEKLMQCDSRLHSLSRQPEIILDSPFFESSRCTTFDDQGAKLHRFDDLKGEFDRSSFQGFLEMSSPSACPSSSRSGDFRDHTLTPDGSSHDALSPSSAMESGINEESTSSGIRELRSFPKWDQLKLPGIHPSMSMTDLVNHIENCISQQRTASGNSCFPGISTTEKDVLLDDITQYLLSDSQNISPSDENSLMSRVNSLCCLLQKEPPGATSAAPSLHPVSESVSSDKRPPFAMQTPEEKLKDDVAAQNSIPRKESYGDLLHHLPRIASLPQFFFSVSDDSADKAR